ncbi:general transcription factor 3C polypeptide 3-like isoform X2 [Penaeus vannamei]|nr:general transcription factor 3C polypeptide 3-like [Penaeus vannamei]
MNSSIKISELSGRDQVEEEDEEQQGNTHQNAYTDLMNMAPLNTAMTELLGRGELPVGAITSAHVGSTEEVLGLPYMESCVTLPELGGTDHVEVEMIEAEPGDNDENEYEDGQQNEYTKLLNMEPMSASMSEFLEHAQLGERSSTASTSAISDEAEVLGLTHSIPTIEADEVGEESYLGMTAIEAAGEETEDDEDTLTEPLDKQSQEELINRLMTDGMSFSEVAALWGEDADADSDVEDTPAMALSKTEEKEDHAAEFEKELNEQQRYQLKRKGGGEKRRRRRLPAALQGLMGEANLRYARQEYDEAIKMCMEVIRQFSHSPEPYQTLGMIYEEKKMANKSLQFLLIAAFLSPDAEEWEKLADLSLHQGDFQQAVFCWGRAIKANPQNLDYHWARCDLLERLGEKLKALKGYSHMLKYLRTDQGKDGLKLAKEIAKIHYENKDVHLARDAMETAFRKYPSYVTPEDVNLMLEVLMHQQEYTKCIEILINHAGVQLLNKNVGEEEFHSRSLEEQLSQATECYVPADLLIDLHTKLTVSLIHVKAFEISAPLVEQLMNESVEEFGDLYLDIAEAYMDVDFHEAALQLLRPLINSDHYNVAAVWLQYGESLAAVDQMEEAAEAYNKVVRLAPQHAEARLTLSSILQSLGRLDEALLILNQESDFEPLDSQLLFQRCKILLDQNLVDEFINAAKLLFRRHFIHIRNRDEAEAMISNKKLSNKYEAIRELRRSKNESLEDNGPAYTGPDVSIEDQWELFTSVCNILHEKKRFEELERMTFTALGSKEFMKDKERAREVEFMCLLACIYNESSYFAYNIMRELVIKNPENERCWNLLNLIISKADDFRHNRFLLRLTHKHPDLVALGLLNGHNCLVAGTYKYSLAEYTGAFKQDPSNPLIPLMLGLTFTHMACQKFSGKKHSLVVQACAFLNTYVEMRGECQESMYNLGRAMHQLNLLPQAIHYYKQALNCQPVESLEGGPMLDLSREIAFNLALIYQNSGSPDLARMYMYKYIQI